MQFISKAKEIKFQLNKLKWRRFFSFRPVTLPAHIHLLFTVSLLWFSMGQLQAKELKRYETHGHLLLPLDGHWTATANMPLDGSAAVAGDGASARCEQDPGKWQEDAHKFPQSCINSTVVTSWHNFSIKLPFHSIAKIIFRWRCIDHDVHDDNDDDVRESVVFVVWLWLIDAVGTDEAAFFDRESSWAVVIAGRLSLALAN